jgi:hypothetical protein
MRKITGIGQRGRKENSEPACEESVNAFTCFIIFKPNHIIQVKAAAVKNE